MSNTDDMMEKLSALVDNELNELDERRVMVALEKDPGLRQTWERYHLVRSALRRELDAFVPPDMAAQLAARIANEPADVTGQRRRRTTRLVGTLAMAASVAVIAVAAVQWINHRPAAEPAATLAAGPVAPENIVRAGAGAVERDLGEREAENALNTFLVEHNEFASSSGIGGMMPYVRVVGSDNRK